jgi:hypothetical protein
MDPHLILYELAGLVDITADDLETIRRWVDEARSVGEGARPWSLLGEALGRLDVHIAGLRRIADRARRAGEGLIPEAPAEAGRRSP